MVHAIWVFKHGVKYKTNSDDLYISGYFRFHKVHTFMESAKNFNPSSVKLEEYQGTFAFYIRTCSNIWAILKRISLWAFNMKKKLCNIFYATVSYFISTNRLRLIAHWFWAINRIFISTNSMYQHLIYSSRLLLSNFIALPLK